MALQDCKRPQRHPAPATKLDWARTRQSHSTAMPNTLQASRVDATRRAPGPGKGRIRALQLQLHPGMVKTGNLPDLPHHTSMCAQCLHGSHVCTASRPHLPDHHLPAGGSRECHDKSPEPARKLLRDGPYAGRLEKEMATETNTSLMLIMTLFGKPLYWRSLG